MTVDTEKRALGVFSNYSELQTALNELMNSGFSMNQISVIGKDMDNLSQNRSLEGVTLQDAAELTKADEGAKTGAIAGGAVGGLTGLLVGLGTLAIPGVGPIMLAGATATALATTVAGGAIGSAAGSLVGALVGLGIPEDRAEAYQNYIANGDYVIIVDGTELEVRQAEAVLRRHRLRDWSTYNRSSVRPPVV